MKRLFRTLLLAGASIFCLSFALWQTEPGFSAITFTPFGTKERVSLPWKFEGPPSIRHIEVRFQRRLAMSGIWQVIPDDFLLDVTANGKSVSLAAIPEAALHDWSRGFPLDLGPYLQPGENVLAFTVNNAGGPGGLQLRAHVGAPGMLLIAVGVLFLLAALHPWMPLTRGQYFIILLGLVVLLAYWNVTPWEVRTHDVGLPTGHMGYAYWIAEHLAIPMPTAGWTFYHPPYYYVIAAAILRGADALSISRPESLQLFSLCLWIIFLMASSACLRVCLRGREYVLLCATAALVLWPSGIIHSIRIGNDTPAYACCALASLSMLRWWKTRRRMDLIGFTLWTMLALMSKTSAMALVGAGATLLGWRILFPGREGRWWASARTAFFAIASIIGFILSQGNSIYRHLNGELGAWLVSNVGGLSSALRVPVSAKAFIPMDIPTFIVTPWANPWEDASGRWNFWNYLLRNSLSGEFQFEGLLATTLSIIWGIALLTLCVLTLRSLGQTLRTAGSLQRYRMRPLLLLGGFWLASLIALRIQAPFSCSNDFRYILPILIPAIALAAASGRIQRGLLLTIALSSAYFFAVLQ